MGEPLAALMAWCRARGIRGAYRVWCDPPRWRARVRVGTIVVTAPAATREQALDRAAGSALNHLSDPMPQPGTRDYVDWQERRANRASGRRGSA